MGKLLREFKLQMPLFKGLECDSNAAYTFILGDLNYRLESTFTKLTPVINDSLTKPELDQLGNEMNKGFYPDYIE